MKKIPFFQKYPLQGIKALDFQCFCEVSKIMESKGHLTDEGLKKIKSLKSGMNAPLNPLPSLGGRGSFGGIEIYLMIHLSK